MFDVLYSALRIFPASDSWALINRQEDFENAHYSAVHALRRVVCLARTSHDPRFFWENVNETASRFAGQHSAHIVVRKKHFFAKNVG